MSYFGKNHISVTIFDDRDKNKIKKLQISIDYISFFKNGKIDFDESNSAFITIKQLEHLKSLKFDRVFVQFFSTIHGTITAIPETWNREEFFQYLKKIPIKKDIEIPSIEKINQIPEPIKNNPKISEPEIKKPHEKKIETKKDIPKEKLKKTNRKQTDITKFF